MLRSRRFGKLAISDLAADHAVAVGTRPACVRALSEAGSLEDLLGECDGVLEGGGGGVRGSLGAALLRPELDDVAVEPGAVELGVRHVARAGDAAAAGGSPAEAVEGLGHGPLGGGVEELRGGQQLEMGVKKS